MRFAENNTIGSADRGVCMADRIHAAAAARGKIME
jgi:hypothetical protein